jgi:hypothetical protein
VSTLQALTTADVEQRARDELNHVTTCHDENLTLCGLDATDIPWAPFKRTTCVVCSELDEMDCDCPPRCWCGCYWGEQP